MPHVEIWQSKPQWQTATVGERNHVIQTLTQLVREHGERIETSGPYLHYAGRACSLIWDVKPERAHELQTQYENLLAAYFEPLMSGTAGQLTAKDYFDRMSRPRRM